MTPASTKRKAALALVLIAIFVLAGTAACGSSSATSTSGSSAPKFAFGLSAQVIASGADATSVRAMDFAPDGRMFYAEQFSGDIRIVLADGTLQPTPFATLRVANYLDLDWGLTGLALDPQFATNHFVYAFYTAPVADKIGKPTIVRFTDSNGTGQDQFVISSDLPLTFPNHQGYDANGEIHFGPDGFLYASLGDYDQGAAKPADGGHPELINDLSSPIGKLLRLNKEDGSAAPGNPFAAQAGADPRVFDYGFREPFSFIFDPVSGTIYGSDNTTVSCEELNVITAGQGYGWATPGMSAADFPFANCAAGTGQQPIYNYSREGTAPGDFLSFVQTQGISFLKNSTYGQLTDGLLVCESQKSVLKDASGKDVISPGALVRFVMTSPTAVASSDLIVNDCKGDAYVHDGVIYYSDATQLLKLTQTRQSGTNQQLPPSAGLTPPTVVSEPAMARDANRAVRCRDRLPVKAIPTIPRVHGHPLEDTAPLIFRSVRSIRTTTYRTQRRDRWGRTLDCGQTRIEPPPAPELLLRWRPDRSCDHGTRSQ